MAIFLFLNYNCLLYILTIKQVIDCVSGYCNTSTRQLGSDVTIQKRWVKRQSNHKVIYGGSTERY